MKMHKGIFDEGLERIASVIKAQELPGLPEEDEGPVGTYVLVGYKPDGQRVILDEGTEDEMWEGLGDVEASDIGLPGFKEFGVEKGEPHSKITRGDW